MGGCVGVDVSGWVVVDTQVFLSVASASGCDLLAPGDRLNIMRSFELEGTPAEVQLSIITYNIAIVKLCRDVLQYHVIIDTLIYVQKMYRTW